MVGILGSAADRPTDLLGQEHRAAAFGGDDRGLDVPLHSEGIGEPGRDAPCTEHPAELVLPGHLLAHQGAQSPCAVVVRLARAARG